MLTCRELEGRNLERLHHLAAPKEAEITAARPGRSGRFLLRQFGEVGSTIELFDDRDGRRLVLDENVARVNFGFALELLGKRLITLEQGLLGQAFVEHPLNRRLLKKLAFGRRKLQLVGFRFLERQPPALGRQNVHAHHPIEKMRIQGLDRQLTVLLGQTAGSGFHLAQVDGTTVDGRDDNVIDVIGGLRGTRSNHHHDSSQGGTPVEHLISPPVWARIMLLVDGLVKDEPRHICDAMDNKHPRHRNIWLWLGVLGAGVLLLIAWLHGRYPDTLASRDGQISIVHGILILGLVASSLVVRGRMKFGKILRDAALWVAIAGLILIGYSFRHDAAWLGQRLVGEINPSAGISETRSIRFPASVDGHYSVDATVDGEVIRFLVDTGASDVVLSPADARRLGFDVESLSFSRSYNTANGTVQGAPIRLGSIQVGPVRVEDVRASVNSADMNRSLLGMSFLERTGGFDVRNDTLTLYQ